MGFDRKAVEICLVYEVVDDACISDARNEDDGRNSDGRDGTLLVAEGERLRMVA